MLERQADRIDNYPELEQRVKTHLEETRWQAEKVKECLGMLNADPSFLKNSLGKISGNFSALGAMFSNDEIVKDTLANSTFEHLEISSYKIIIAAAEHAGEQEIADICRQILKQEEAMAQWLDEHVEETTTTFLSRASSGAEARV
jgi:ferritin-like metal-binding protein YciE